MASSQTRSNNGRNKRSSSAGAGANDGQIIELSAAPGNLQCVGGVTTIAENRDLLTLSALRRRFIYTYQGVPGVYFEATTGKAYPKSEDIRCDQFDVAFQAVELWITDRLVLPIET
ncbi:predicted protein [Arabidopsis lyrata subsp. lyrata]|uniref:Predicted protein n=1 Tax=Arabidopsis lyrata subsp. lyrata TaxID=81972 RepID=D7KU61_ARALL|nr:predicted protein [Arabidopsis lyrata subsp. lyrata]